MSAAVISYQTADGVEPTASCSQVLNRGKVSLSAEQVYIGVWEGFCRTINVFLIVFLVGLSFCRTVNVFLIVFLVGLLFCRSINMLLIVFLVGLLFYRTMNVFLIVFLVGLLFCRTMNVLLIVFHVRLLFCRSINVLLIVFHAGLLFCRTMNVFLIVFLVVLLCQGALCTGLMYWKQNTISGTPSYVYTEKPDVTVSHVAVLWIGECTVLGAVYMEGG